jgi:hypothetical protein
MAQPALSPCPPPWPIQHPLLSRSGPPVSCALDRRPAPTCHPLRSLQPAEPFLPRTSCSPSAPSPPVILPSLPQVAHSSTMAGPWEHKAPSAPPRVTTPPHQLLRVAAVASPVTAVRAAGAPPSSPERRPKVSSMADNLYFPHPLSPVGV